jgi:hypothetical protein
MSIKFHLIHRAEFIKHHDKVLHSVMSMNGFDFRFICACGGPWFCGAVCATTGATANALSSRSRAGTCAHTDSAVLTDAGVTRSHKISPPRHATPHDAAHDAAQCTPPTYCRAPRRPKDHRLYRRRRKKSQVNCYRGESYSFLSRCRKITPTVFRVINRVT